MAAELKLRSLSEVAVIGPTGKLEIQMQAVFMVGEFGPFTYSVPKDEYNAATFRMSLENKARDVATVAGLLG